MFINNEATTIFMAFPGSIFYFPDIMLNNIISGTNDSEAMPGI
jgi:hypothetical protein